MSSRIKLCICFVLCVLTSCTQDSNATNTAPQTDNALLDEAVPPGLQDILINPDRVTLFTIVTGKDAPVLGDEVFARLPLFNDQEKGMSKSGPPRVLARAELRSDDALKLISTLVAAINDGERGGVACFYPHHALRVEKDQRWLDMLICFECYNYKILPGGGSNNVHMSRETGMEDAWRAVVRRHGLRDVSDKGK